MNQSIYSYEAPDLQVVETSVERGFAATEETDVVKYTVYSDNEDYL
jgi:hypothetical protein